MHYFLYVNGSKGAKSFGIPYPVTKLWGFSSSKMDIISDELYKSAQENGIKTEFIHCCIDGGIKGVLFPELKKGVVNIPFYEESGMFLCLSDEAAKAKQEIKAAHKCFEEALLIHDEWEKYYINNFDFGAIDDECDALKENLLNEKWGTEGGIVKDRFLGAATAYGSIDYIEDITSDIKSRYFIKGRPGSGKSTFMKKIANACTERGYNVERYHCSFDPQSLDMIVIRGLDTCIFDSTPPHEHFPSRSNDFIIDFYEIAAKRNIDREYKQELSYISNEYKNKISEATEYIKRANSIYKELEKKQDEFINNEMLQDYIYTLCDNIFSL